MKTLEIAGKEYNITKKLGEGNFSQVYLLDNGNVLIFTYDDKSKQKLVGIDNPHLPKLDYIGQHGIYECYTSPYYKPLDFDAPAYDQYEKIINIEYIYRENNWLEDVKEYIAEYVQNILEHICHMLPELKNAIETLRQLIDDNFCLDIKQDNFAIGADGQLILLDVFYYRN